VSLGGLLPSQESVLLFRQHIIHRDKFFRILPQASVLLFFLAHQDYLY